MNFFLTSLLLMVITFFSLKRKILSFKEKEKPSKGTSLSRYYIYCSSLWLVIIFSIIAFIPNTNNIFYLKTILLFLCSIINFSVFCYLFKIGFNARKHFEKIIKIILLAATIIGVSITALITLSILFEAIKFFDLVELKDFLFGTKWNPQLSSADSVVKDSFGVIPVITGTLLITFIAIFVSIPIGIFSAIYLSEYANKRVRNTIKPIIEILAGIPTVVYGYFAIIVIAPSFKILFSYFNLDIALESALAAGVVMGIMIIPFVLSLTDDAINAVPSSLKDGAFALGSTKMEVIQRVILVSAFPTILSAILLAISRAIGETMIVTMAAGLTAKLTINPLDSVTTATAQIVTLLTGDQESNSPKTLAAFAIGLLLFLMTLILNIIALLISKKYTKRYG